MYIHVLCISDKCYLPQSIGRCGDFIAKYYYNAATSQCETFMYGSCLGNDNRFNDEQTCVDECVKPQQPGEYIIVVCQ